ALDTTIAALSDLVNNPGPDFKPQFAAFSKSLDQLVATGKRNEAAVKNVNEKSAAYFETWDKQIKTVNYEVIRTQASARKVEVTKNFDDVNQHYKEAQAALHPLMDYLQDIRKTLSTDLTIGGLQSAKNLLTNAQENTTKVQAALAKVSKDLATASVN